MINNRSLIILYVICLFPLLLLSQQLTNKYALSDKFPRGLIAEGEAWVNSTNPSNQQKVGLGYLTMARGYSLLGDEDIAEGIISHAIQEFTKKGDDISIAEANLQWAEILVGKGKFQQATELYVNLLNYGKENRDTTYLALGYNGLGLVCRNFQEFSKARQYFEIALELSTKSREENCLSVINKNLGTYYYYLKNYEVAYNYYTKSLGYWKDKGIHEEKCGILNNQGNVLREQGKLFQAGQKYNEALLMAQQLGSVYMHTVIIKNLGTIALKSKNYNEAFTLFDHSLLDSREYKLKRIEKDILKQLAVLNTEIGNYKVSNEMFILYEHIQDSISSQNQYQNIVSTINKLDKDRDIHKASEYQKNIQLGKLTTTRNYLFLIITVLLLIIGFIIIIYNYILKARVNRALQTQRDEIILQKEDLTKLNAILKQHNEESERLVLDRTYELQHINDLLRQEIDERKKAVQSLHDYQDYLMELLNSVADPIFVKDQEHKWVLVNDAAILIFGAPREQLLGKSDYDFFPKDEARVFWEKDDVVLINGVENVNEEQITTFKGDTHIIETKKKRYINKNGEKFIVGIISDITEQRILQQQILELNQSLENKILERTHQLQTSISNLETEIEKRKAIEIELIDNRERLNNLLENIPVGILHIDKEGRIHMANKSFLKILDLTEDEFKKRNLIFDYPCFVDPVMMNFLKALIIKKEAFDVDSQYIKTDKGRNIYVHCRGVPILENNEEFYTLVISDVTERRTISNELIEQKEKAEKASLLKSHFLSNMSHEIRTPLTGILGYAELLDEEIVDEHKLDMINKITLSGRRLLSTLDAVLMLSRLQSTQIVPEIHAVDVRSVIEYVLVQYYPVSQEKGIPLGFEFGEVEMLKTDGSLLFELISKLLDNAFKFTLEGEIKVTTSTQKQNKIEGCLIQISDTGIGIEEDKKDYIFDDFRQGSEGWSRSFEGNGLGLSIAKRIIDLLNGRIWIENNDKQGVVFNVWLPLR